MPTNRIWLSQQLLWLSKWVTLSNMTFTMTFMTFVMTFEAQSHKPQMASEQALWWVFNRFYDFYEFRETFLPLSVFWDYLFFFSLRDPKSPKSLESHIFRRYWRHDAVYRYDFWSWKSYFLLQKSYLRMKVILLSRLAKKKAPTFLTITFGKGAKGKTKSKS